MGNLYKISAPCPNYYIDNEVNIYIKWFKIRDLSYLFHNLNELIIIKIDFWSSEINDTSYLFCLWVNLKIVDLPEENGIVNMSHKTHNCISLQIVNLSKLDASNVKHMPYLLKD